MNICKKTVLLIICLCFIFCGITTYAVAPTETGSFYSEDKCAGSSSSYSTNEYYNQIMYGINAAHKKANLTIHKLTMRQSDSYYYIDYDVDYKSDIDYDLNKAIGTETHYNHATEEWRASKYQTINPGNIFVTKTSINGVTLNYYNKIYFALNSGSDTFKMINNVNGNGFSYEVTRPRSGYDTVSSYTFNPYPQPIAGLNSIYYTGSNRLQGLSLRNVPAGGYASWVYAVSNGGGSVSQTATVLDESKWAYNFKGTLTVPKSNYNNFNFMGLNAPTGITVRYSGKTGSYLSNGSGNRVDWGYCGLYGECYDISKMYKCGSYYDEELGQIVEGNDEHNWVYINEATKEYHKVYCTKCEWEKREDHNYQYEYDGMQDNACVCGCIDKVRYNFIINDDYTTTDSKIFDSYSDYKKTEYQFKTGYEFKYYEKSERQYMDEINLNLSETHTELKEVPVATCSIMTDRTSLYSTNYKAIYRPHKYVVRYSNINNMNIELDGQIEDQEFTYDVAQNLRDNIDHIGYTFLGWTRTEGGSTVEFNDTSEVINLTANDNEIITLYPIYKICRYIVRYSNVNNKNINLEGQIEDQEFTYDVAQNLRNNIEHIGYTFLGWTRIASSSTVEFNKNEQVINLAGSDCVINLYPIYRPHKYYIHYSNINNKNLELDGQIEDQEFTYDVAESLKDNIVHIGYGFVGWSDNIASLSCAKYTSNEEVINLNSNDNAIVTLYPVYSEYGFKVIYSTGMGTFNNGAKTIERTYMFSDNSVIEGINLGQGSSYGFNGYASNETDKIFKNMADIKLYIGNKGISNYTLILNATFYHPGVGSAEHGAGGNGPDSKKKIIVIENDVNEDTNPEPYVIDTPKQYVFNDIVIDDKVIEEIVNDASEISDKDIFALTDTQKFYIKYGLVVSSKKDYNKSYYKYSVKKMTKFQVLLYKLSNYKMLMASLLLLGILLLYLYVRKEKYEKKK